MPVQASQPADVSSLDAGCAQPGGVSADCGRGGIPVAVTVHGADRLGEILARDEDGPAWRSLGPLRLETGGFLSSSCLRAGFVQQIVAGLVDCGRAGEQRRIGYVQVVQEAFHPGRMRRCGWRA